MHTSDVQEFRLAVGRIGRRLRQLYGTDAALGPISPIQLSVLARLRRTPRLSPGEIAREERVTSQAVAIAVRALIDRGLVDRSADDRDHRRAMLSLTATGDALIRSREHAVVGPLGAAMEAAITEQDDLPAVINLIRRIADAL